MGLFYSLHYSLSLAHLMRNLTDGLDGLATVPVMLVALSFTLISYVLEHNLFGFTVNIFRRGDYFCGSVVSLFRFSGTTFSQNFMGDTDRFLWWVISCHSNYCKT